MEHITDDEESANILTREIQSEDCNPILIYNPQGVVDPSKVWCLLAIQTKFQLQMYQQYMLTVILFLTANIVNYNLGLNYN